LLPNTVGLALIAAGAATLFAADIPGRVSGPTINLDGVVNAAGFIPAPENFVAPLSIISIFGTGLALRTKAVGVGDLERGRLATHLDGVEVFVNGIALPLYFVSPEQINAQVSHLLVPRPGPWPIEVQREGLASPMVFEVHVRTAAPGLFPAMTHQDFSLLGRNDPIDSTPAAPGELIVLFGTGFGPMIPAVFSGELPSYAARITLPWSVTLDGDTLPPEAVPYIGQTPYLAGLYQVNLILPIDLAASDPEVIVEVAGALSQPGARIPVGW
jgi:uncharacterized protein (TIGR03437 family)